VCQGSRSWRGIASLTRHLFLGGGRVRRGFCFPKRCKLLGFLLQARACACASMCVCASTWHVYAHAQDRLHVHSVCTGTVADDPLSSSARHTSGAATNAKSLAGCALADAGSVDMAPQTRCNMLDQLHRPLDLPDHSEHLPVTHLSGCFLLESQLLGVLRHVLVVVQVAITQAKRRHGGLVRRCRWPPLGRHLPHPQHPQTPRDTEAQARARA